MTCGIRLSLTNLTANFAVWMFARMNVDIGVAAFDFADKRLNRTAGKRTNEVAASQRACYNAASEGYALSRRAKQGSDNRAILSAAAKVDIGLRDAPDVAQGKAEAKLRIAASSVIPVISVFHVAAIVHVVFIFKMAPSPDFLENGKPRCVCTDWRNFISAS
jgi:hypothetical protein